jgi:hypothetical protein
MLMSQGGPASEPRVSHRQTRLRLSQLAGGTALLDPVEGRLAQRLERPAYFHAITRRVCESGEAVLEYSIFGITQRRELLSS